MTIRPGLLLTAAIAAAPVAARTQIEATNIHLTVALSHGAAAWDPVRGRTIVVNSAGTSFEYDGESWFHVGELPRPKGRPELAHQHHRTRTLAVLLPDNGLDLQTFEYDGSGWHQRHPSNWPPARERTHLTYDIVRQRAVLFGGSIRNKVRFDDTWEWDGDLWRRRFPQHSPEARDRAAMAFDIARGVTVLFGGNSQSAALADHWEWNGADWRQRTFPTMPATRSNAGMAFDANRTRLVLFGGFRNTGVALLPRAIWEFDGQSWQRRDDLTPPEGRTGHSLVESSTGVTSLGGSDFPPGVDRQIYDIVDYDGNRASNRYSGRPATTVAAYDEERRLTVAFTYGGDINRTFEWDGHRRIERTDGDTPSGTMLLTPDVGGGILGLQGVNNTFATWSFGHHGWARRSAASPPYRAIPALAHDPSKDRVLLFGGRLGQQHLRDLWAWDGTTWLPTPSLGAPTIARPLMAFDRFCQQMALTESALETSQPSTWFLNGNRWQRSPVGGSPALAMTSSRDGIAAISPASTALPNELGAWTVSLFWPNNHTSHWIGQSFSPQAIAPDANGNLIIFGGRHGSDITLAARYPAQVTSIGVSCSSNGNPARTICRDIPRIGTDLRLEVIGAEAHGLALIVASLPDYGVRIGPCRTVVNDPIHLSLHVTSRAGYATTDLPIPNEPSLHRLRLSAQSIVAETAGPIGNAFALTEGLRILVGY
ncbi:MAG: hypothetical protein NXI31_07030 [bacterium]|nr:hypothetical protein [bacterium]